MSKSGCKAPLIPFYRGFCKTKKGPGTIFEAAFFVAFFEKNFTYVILHKRLNFITRLFISNVLQ